MITSSAMWAQRLALEIEKYIQGGGEPGTPETHRIITGIFDQMRDEVARESRDQLSQLTRDLTASRQAVRALNKENMKLKEQAITTQMQIKRMQTSWA